MNILNKFTGCLFGGAVGDALGYPVEFMNEKEIKKYFGESGITKYCLDTQKKALISDDTQMTLFTTNGLISGFTKSNGKKSENGFMESIRLSYLDWYKTQTKPKPDSIPPKSSWIANMPYIYDLRAPGNTCLTSCSLGANGTPENPINASCGCGGVMRVAPIGLMFNPANGYSIEEIDMFGARAAALTHGHQLGYIPAAALVHIVNRLTYTKMTPREAVEDAIVTINKIFTPSESLNKVTILMQTALDLAANSQNDLVAIHKLGRGWTGDEALAIAIYCAVKYCKDFTKAVIVSVNHRGDSDSTGSITGNILGAYLGFDDIPAKYRNDVELRDMIMELATDLYYCGVPTVSELMDDAIWQQKYVHMTYNEI